MLSGLCASFGYMIVPCVIGVVLLVWSDWCGFGTCGVIDLLLIKYRQMVSV